MTHLSDISRALSRPHLDVCADAIIADLMNTMAQHTNPRPLDMVGPREAAESDTLRVMLVATERLARKRLGVNAGDLIQALIDGNTAATEAAMGRDCDSEIESATACLRDACDELAEEWAANMEVQS